MGQLPNGTLNQLSSNYKSHVSRIGLKSKFIFSLISSLITDNDFIVIDRILVWKLKTRSSEELSFESRVDVLIGNIGIKRVPLSSKPLSLQHISSTQKGHSFSALKSPQFHNENPSVQHTSQFHTKNPSVQHTHQFQTSVSGWRFFGVELTGFWCGIEECVKLRGFGVELRSFWCWTEEFWVLKRCGPCAELKGSVWNLGVLVSKQEFRPEKYALIFKVLVGNRYFESTEKFRVEILCLKEIKDRKLVLWVNQNYL